jgi:CBS domain containing-hemolysin-like protein
MQKDLPHKIDLRDRKLRKKKDNWVLKITIITFFIALFLGFFSDVLSKNINIYLACLVLVVIVFIGILFDVVGIAIAAADEKPLHAMSSRKIRGAKQALLLLKNAEKTTNFCNDVVGDIAGIISGATSTTIGAYLIVIISAKMEFLENPLAVIFVFAGVSAFVAAITVGGKAFGKKIAILKANDIVFFVGRVIAVIRKD